jgi:hypothetical protein
MNCPSCLSMTTKEQNKKTSPGYRTFRCSACKQTFNERIGTPFNFLEYPTDLVPLVVLWRLRDILSLRDVAEMGLSKALCSPIKPFGIGKRGSPRCLRISYGESERTNRHRLACR